jgi:hypothetical protein
MALLLSWAQQQAAKPFSLNSEPKYAQIASEVESLEVDKLLGSAFYQAVSADPTNADYVKILDEYEFTRADGVNTIKHKGLRYVIAYLNYAKYIGESHIIPTATGLRQKTTPESEPVGSGEIKRLQQEYREIAFNAFNLIREYLDLNTATYTLWDSDSDKKVQRPNFYSVKKTLS